MKNLLFTSFLLSIAFSIAQNRSINFESGNFASVLQKAQKETKLIFIDAYTSWCGPCKQMAKRVFTNDSVADHFNAKFVNYKMDMEKGEGIEFAKKYEVNCYPNLLIIDSKGILVHRSAGLLEAPVFLAFARTAVTPGKTFIDQKNTFLKTGLNENNIKEYISLMESACFQPVADVNEYIAKVKESDLINPANWELVRDYVENYQSREIKYLLANLERFESKYGKKEVDKKFADLGANYFEPFVKSKELDKTAYEKATLDFKTLNWPQSDKVLFDADLKISHRFEKPKFYSLAASGYLKYNNDNPIALNSMAWKFFEEVNDKEQLNAAVGMAKRACELSPHYANLDTYAAVLFKAGNYNEADKMAALSIQKAKEQKVNEDEYKGTVELQKKIKAKLNSK